MLLNEANILLDEAGVLLVAANVLLEAACVLLHGSLFAADDGERAAGGVLTTASNANRTAWYYNILHISNKIEAMAIAGRNLRTAVPRC